MLCKMYEKPCVVSVARKTLPALKATAMKDFFEVLKSQDIYNPDCHNKTENTYTIGKSEIEFISVDQPQKIRGRKRDYLWLNETNEFSREDYRQLAMRTTRQIYMDYNPSDLNSWIYDDILTRKDVTLIKSTYKDNPFLEDELIREIEEYQKVDENYWNIYGLGLRGVSQSNIYGAWDFVDALPDGDSIYGLDFGYNHPTALVEIGEKDSEFYVDEKLYRRFLTNDEFIKEMDKMKINKKRPIYADGEDAQRIAEIKRAGYWVIEANKEKGSVWAGIDFIKRHRMHLTKTSTNIEKERQKYRWKSRDGVMLDEPVKIDDDGMDATRYPIYTHFGKRKKLSGFI